MDETGRRVPSARRPTKAERPTRTRHGELYTGLGGYHQGRAAIAGND